MTAEATDQQIPTTVTTTTTWMKFARATAIGMVIWAIILHLTARVIVPPVLVIGLIYLAFTPFLTGERRKLGIAYAAVSLLVILGNIPGLVDELSNPESAPAFILTLLSTTLV
nr:hypothetical protein [Acidimicrobiia bacterium]